MNALRELIGLFVEDGSLALAILGVVAAAAILSVLAAAPVATGVVLLVGCLGVLVENILRAQRNVTRPPARQ
jgi:Na+-transporting NADH:ubiquinone oxidoreductase subunit NqrD